MSSIFFRCLIPVLVLVISLATPVIAAEPQAWEMSAAEVVKASTWKSKTTHLVDLGNGKQAAELDEALQLETYGLQTRLAEGWWRMVLRVRPNRAASPDKKPEINLWAPLDAVPRVGPVPEKKLEISLWNPHGSPGAFRFTSAFDPVEFGPGDQPVNLKRNLRIGPANGNIGIQMLGGWKGLQIEAIRFEPLKDGVFLESVKADRLVYGTQESGTVAVALRSITDKPQRARLVVEIESGLGQPVSLHDAEIDIPAAGAAVHRVTVKLPVQSEYGHQLRAVLYRPGKGGEVLSEARDWFYVSDKPLRIGHLRAWPSARDYEPKNIDQFIAEQRRICFPLAELTFWAPDDYMMLVPPAGKDRWWSGQTLAQLSTATIKARIAALHAQGMKAISYTDLRVAFGFRVVELFRQHPEWSDWSPSANSFSPAEIAIQVREDDNERFDPKAPNKPRFGARGVYAPMTGNPAAVDYHINQLVASTKYFDWDGFRYDDYCDYDFPATDLLGNQVPYRGFTVPVLVTRLRNAIEQAKPGIIYGRNFEWTPRIGASSGENWVTQVNGTPDLETPMPLDAPPLAESDYYTEHLRNDGLHLQERTTAYWGDGANWEEMADKLNRLGNNAARRGGHAYAITQTHNWAIDGRTMTALMMAGRVHLAFHASEWQVPYLRLAARHCDLIYGDTLRPAPAGTLAVEAKGGRAVWWQRYVRVLEPAPGKRVYLVHLINPPVKPGVDAKNTLPPPTATDLTLNWSLPSGWKAERAWHLTADKGDGLETTITPDPKCETTVVSHGSAPRRESLPLKASGKGAELTVPGVVQWSIVAIECSGPASDRLQNWRFPLPPKPTVPAEFTTAPAPVIVSPNALQPKVFAASHPAWKLQTGRVVDPACSEGNAVVVKAPLRTETYFTGVRGGLYQFVLRVKTPAAPPADAKLNLRCWAAYQVWVVEKEFPLKGLVPGVWTDLIIEAKVGYDRGNCGVLVSGGWDGLLIDRLEVRELKVQSEAESFTQQKLRRWPANLAPAADGSTFCLDGLWHELLGLPAALKKLDIPMTEGGWYAFQGQHTWSNEPKLKNPEDLAKYRLLVLADVDLRTLSLEQRAWIKGWVEAGGSLLMTGGPYGFGCGWWQESDLLAPILPATMKPYDLKPAATPLPLKAAGPLLATLNLPADSVTVWMHDLAPKPGAEVALTAGGRPALILGRAGKGRVALLTLAPLGKDVNGAWWRSDAGEKITEATCRWLLGQR
jgi:hypothetical protein